MTHETSGGWQLSRPRRARPSGSELGLAQGQNGGKLRVRDGHDREPPAANQAEFGEALVGLDGSEGHRLDDGPERGQVDGNPGGTPRVPVW